MNSMTKTEFSELVERIKANLDQVEACIARAVAKAGRERLDIIIVAVTKLLPLKMVEAGIAAGLRSFGENYPEQAVEKIAAFKENTDVTWHMIGHIQSRKASLVCENFDWVHAVDRIRIARYLDRYSREAERIMPALIEVNLSGEESKFGWKAWDEDSWPELIPQFAEISQLRNIQIHGLMSMPPYFDDPELTRPYYQRLRRLQTFLREQLPDMIWDQLSIGTSFDFEVAIEEGATMVRLGTTIFGSRPEA
jgi:PLP dependent protein